MKKLTFSFLTDKLFLSGLITGIVISAIAFTLILSANSASPDKATIKGTMAGTTYVPSVGELGVAQSTGTQCNLEYTDVIFDNDPNHTVIRCHSDGSPSAGMQVQVVSVTSGEFCSGGGINLSIVPAIN
jgi:hypothetical protein